MGFGTWAAKFEKFANGLKIKNFRKKTGVFRTGTNCNWWTAKEPKKGVLTAARTYYYPYCPFRWVPPPRGFSLISLKLQGLYPHKPLQLKYTTWTSPIKLCDWGGSMDQNRNFSWDLLNREIYPHLFTNWTSNRLTHSIFSFISIWPWTFHSMIKRSSGAFVVSYTSCFIRFGWIEPWEPELCGILHW